MKRKFLLLFFLFSLSLFFSQEVTKIEFHHSNAIILFKSVDVAFEPIKNNKKGKVTVKKDRDEKYTSRISKKKYSEIFDAIKRIEGDTIAVKHNMIDGSSTSITIYDNLGRENNYHASGLNSNSHKNTFQKDFWYATKLIMKAARLEMEDLIGYR